MDAPSLAFRDTVISQAPKGTVGPALFFYEVNRGPILPPVGSKYRDLTLRIFDRHAYNSSWQGARSGVVKKLASVPYEVNGPPAKTQYYHDMLGYAHLGLGWEHLLKLCLTDYLTQSYGAIFEIAGPGDPTQPLLTAPTGINHLDASRCYVTGNRTFPLLYYSLWDGKLHKLHASRVYMMVDDPIPDERYMGIGTSALERAIAIGQREMRMGQYIDAMLDDKPQPGIVAINNVADPVWQAAVNKFMQQTSNDELPVFGKAVVVTGTDPNAKIEIQIIPFSQTPEKFDFTKYTDLDISALALALGVDRQELWELTGRGIGSGSQSGILAIKSRAKLYGDTLTGIERMMNWAILPDDCEFVFKEKDPMQDQVQTTIDVQLAQAAQILQAIGIKPEAIGRLLVDRSESYQEALTNDLGQVDLVSSDKVPPAQIAQDVNLDSNTPLPALGTPPAPTAPAPGSPSIRPAAFGKPGQASGTKGLSHASKSFGVTSADFRTRFTDILERTIEGRLRAAQAENLMLSLLLSSGRAAYKDGLMEGGIKDPLSDDDEQIVQNWVADTIDYLDPLLVSAQDGILPIAQVDSRADMWINKSLMQMLSAGRASADEDGLYIFTGPDGEESCNTCKRLKGQIHRFKEWQAHQLIPGEDTKNFECGGWHCQHRLRRAGGTSVGAW